VPGTKDTWEKDLHYYRLDGKIDGANRRKLIDDFNDTTINDHCHLFLLSTRAGSLGINLTAANRVVILDSSWNPSHDSQAVCRVYRYGQSRDCHIYRFIASGMGEDGIVWLVGCGGLSLRQCVTSLVTGTMEQTIYNRQVSKLGLSARVVEMDKNPDRHFTADQLDELFNYTVSCG
jgi:RAD54-like protein 2